MSTSEARIDSSPLRVAYLNTRYPALSHTFIQQEILALEELGVEILPFSIRKPSLAELGEGADDHEIRRTVYVLDGVARFGRRLLVAVLCAPIRALRTVIASQRVSPDGLRPRIRHLAYALEGIALATALRRRRVHHVHVHMGNSGAMVAVLARTFEPRVRYSLTIHGPAEFLDVAGLRLARKAHDAEFVRFISDCGRAQTMALTSPSDWERFHVVHCGVRVGFRPARAPRSPGPLRILAIGRLAAVKGFPILLEAVRGLTGRGVPWTLRIAGDGPERSELEALASRLGIDKSVEFLGPVAPPVIQGELQKADVLAQSSFLEGIPVVLMEAMAAGVPVIATRVGGVPELIEDRVSGRLARPGCAEAVEALLHEVWADPQGAAVRAVAGRRMVEQSFDIRGTAKEMRALFERYVVAAGVAGHRT